MHMITKGQMVPGNSQGLSAAEQFYSLVVQKPARVAELHSEEINATHLEVNIEVLYGFY